jgi:acyl-CoA synthetase (AMP-forming)/AMP-acid ligase II/alkylation response protein AidB-like acyl-CoA dehydrogenase
MTQASTLVDLLRQRADTAPSQCAYVFLEDGTRPTGEWSYGALDERARAIAAHLQAAGACGERALLLYPTGIEFLAGFFGCLYAGVIGIPAPAPEASRMKRAGPRLRAIVDDAQASLVLTTSAVQSQVGEAEMQLFGAQPPRWFDTDRMSGERANEWQAPRISDAYLAYLQYTSGSTSAPRGVKISHRNLVYHADYLQRTCGYQPDSVTVTWMPHFHDYGLVEGLLEPLYNATPCYILSPLAFIKRPFHWLQAIGRWRGTHSQAPNFAYDHCVRRVTAEQQEQLDLGSWQAAGIAAEPINPKVLDAFCARFGPRGFRRSSFCPAYGLAEATLMVSFSPSTEDPIILRLQASALEKHRVQEVTDAEPARSVAGCGRLFGATQVAIVRPEMRTRCAPDEVGEVWVADPAVAEGYWQRPQETEEIFRARLADSPEEGPFLRTGDLGFLRDGRLFITGRLKDVIIIRGANYYPQDIEWTVQACHPALRIGHTAAFSILVDGQEELVIAQEVERDYAEGLDVDLVIQAIRQAVAEEYELDVYAVQLLKRGAIPKTASGKIQRQACRSGFLEGKVDVQARWIRPTAKTGDRALRVAECPELSINSRRPFPANGATSLENSRHTADRLIAWLREYAPRRINSRLMDERRSIPPYLILDFGNQGLLGMQVPQAYGGIGLGYRDCARVLEQLAAIDLTLATVVFLNNSNGIRPIQFFAQPPLRDELLSVLARGRELASFALTEPGAGSHLGGLATVADASSGGSWRLRGVKRWNASSWAGVITVIARMREPSGRLGPATAFAVRQGTPGLRIGPEALTMGLRGSVQNALYLHNVAVGPGDVLGDLGGGLAVAEDALAIGRLYTGAVALGAMKRCAQLMLRYATRRAVATGQLLENPVTLHRFGDVSAMIAAVEALLDQLSRMLDAGAPVPAEACMALKIRSSEFLNRTTDALVQLLGGRGYMENNLAPQLLRDARAFTIGEGPNESLNLFLGRSATQTETLERFLADRLGAADLAQQVRAAAEQLTARYAGARAPVADPSVARVWAETQVGAIATDALLLAAMTRTANQNGSASCRRATEWTRRQFEESLRKALASGAGELEAPSSDQVRELVFGYTESIGDIEQTLDGEEQALDPLLSLCPAGKVEHRTEQLPGAATVIEHAPPSGNGVPLASGDQFARLPAPAKRALLASVLRRQVGLCSTDRTESSQPAAPQAAALGPIPARAAQELHSQPRSQSQES